MQRAKIDCAAKPSIDMNTALVTNRAKTNLLAKPEHAVFSHGIHQLVYYLLATAAYTAKKGGDGHHLFDSRNPS